MNSVAPVKITVPDVGTSPACERCKFAEPSGSVFECRLNPPIATFVPGPNGQPTVASGFPLVQARQWCGQYVFRVRVQ